MSNVILTCGRICSGKSTYAKKLAAELGAVILSADEIMLAVFGQDAGENHDLYVERIERYIFNKAVELVNTGINVIIDIGLWTRREREEARGFFRSRGVDCKIHCLDVSDDEQGKRIEARNKEVVSGGKQAYIIDDGIRKKCDSFFEPPSADEIDVFVK